MRDFLTEDVQEVLCDHQPTVDQMKELVAVVSRRAKNRIKFFDTRTPILERLGIQVADCGRGGDVTYHGPGQLVGYPIVDLNRWKRDLHWYLRQLEQTLIDALGELGLASFRYPAFTGVWVGDESALDDSGRATGQVRKIGSIGVHVSRWVTWHGFALNVEPDLGWFDRIVPCGITDKGVTSLAAEWYLAS